MKLFLATLLAVAIFASTSQSINTDGCGVLPRSKRIVGGAEATPHTWPWQASLQHSPNYLSHFCGGTLINANWVVTAAHCLYIGSYRKNPNDLVVLLGEHHHLNEERVQPVTKGVSKIIMPKAFTHFSRNDIALLKLDSPVTFTNEIIPACLPEPNQNFAGNPDCWITGWGDTKAIGYPNALNELNIEVLTNSVCSGKWNGIYSGNICLGNGLSGSCQGDSGGPLSCKLPNNKWIVAGASSWAVTGCMSENRPSVYTRISFFLDWITWQIQLNTDTKVCPMDLKGFYNTYDGTQIYLPNGFDKMTRHQCYKLCERDPDCKAVDYNKFNEDCWKHTTTSGIKRNHGCCYRYEKNDNACQYEVCTMDFAGNYNKDGGTMLYLSKGIATMTDKDCYSLCARDPYCRAVDYNKIVSKCWKHTTTTGIKTDSPCCSRYEKNENNCEYVPCKMVHVGRYNADGGMRLYIVSTGSSTMSGTDCTTLCESDPGCKAVDYNTQNGECWKHGTTEGRMHVDDCCDRYEKDCP